MVKYFYILIFRKNREMSKSQNPKRQSNDVFSLKLLRSFKGHAKMKKHCLTKFEDIQSSKIIYSFRKNLHNSSLNLFRFMYLYTVSLYYIGLKTNVINFSELVHLLILYTNRTSLPFQDDSFCFDDTRA